MRISHNLVAMNANRMFGLENKKKVASAEKLSSGYKINRAADDAAGLSISEKMRRLIRGLNQGTDNAQDGIGWTQIGDGALNEAHEILHRMTELTVKSLNGTNSESDRMALELEFEQLQCELDKIGNNTKFNEIPIFDEHKIPYYQCEGAVKWDPQQKHVVTAGQNDLNIQFSMSESGSMREMSITVPPGEYTTQELVDEIDTVLRESMTDTLIFEFTSEGYCNVNLEGGEKINSVSGGLSYLVYDMYKGGTYGALIGTTSFQTENSRLKVVNGQNNYMSFTIENFSGGSSEQVINIPEGSYTRSELIDLLNNQLTGTTVKASAYGTGIKLASDEAIVTGFKGNMFKIDGSGTVYNSVFYDNVKYGGVSQEPAVFTGGCVLPTDSRDVEHMYYKIDSTANNNTLIIQPNDAASSVTLTIPDGSYTADTMAAKLNELFTNAGLDLTAGRISSSGFEGIKIVSGVEGLDSKVGIDPASSAYNMLFVTREYNAYGSKVYPSNETKADSEGVFKGSKDLSILSSEPLTVVAGQNDKFELEFTSNGTTNTYTITLSGKTYSSVSEVVDEINTQLNGSSALAGYKGKIAVSQENNKIVLTGNIGQAVDKIRVKAIQGNDGFDKIFQGYNSNTTYPTASGNNSITLNTPFDGTLDASESQMTIKVDGNNYNVTLPTGSVTQDDIKNAIETAIPPRTETTNNEFATVTGNGYSTSRNFDTTARGNTSSPSWSDSVTGDSKLLEGQVGFDWNKPATMEIGVNLKSSMTVTSANNAITLTINGDTRTITLDNKTYSPSSLATALQQKIDATFGTTDLKGAIVSLNNNRLVLTSRLPDGYDGKDTSLSCSTASSSFLKELNTTRSAAEWESDNTLASAIEIDSSNQTFNFTYGAGGNTQTVSLTLTQGTYNQAGIVAEINNQLTKTGTGITADLSSGKLTLTSDAVGSDVSIRYNTATGGTSAETLFGPLNQPSPAQIVVNLKTEDSIKIEAGVSDIFTIKVNGTDRTITLGEGTYDRDSFEDMINEKFEQAGIGVKAFVSGNKLGFQTVATGSSASVAMTYADGGTSMVAIYGQDTKTYSGVTVSFDADGKMGLATTKSGSSISVAAGNGGAFQQAVVVQVPISTDYTDGYHSTKKSYIDGASLSGDVTIDQWNNELKFSFKNNTTTQNVSITIPENTYTYDQLKTELENQINTQVGAGLVNVTVNSSGVRLEAVNTGSNYQFSSFSGDFYDKVICSCTEKSAAQTVSDQVGTQTVDSVFTVGRKDVKNVVTELKRGISDELSLDLTYGGTVHTINVVLDAGKYNGNQLKAHLQEKLNEQLAAMGLEENLIEVGIGGINTGVYGSNDGNALNFSLSKTVQAPAEGQFIIDGVSGNAAFEIFYQTDGKMEPAYIKGTKDVSGGVTIPEDETEMSFVVDGATYDITLPTGDYSAIEIRDIMNDAFDAAGAPIVAEIDEGVMKISHRKLGVHEIEGVFGDARDNIFFEENGEKDERVHRDVQLSSEVPDYIELNRHLFTTAHLGLNSCCISTERNATKALDRINEALRMISNIRSDFGSTQNRLEHAINNNENKAENLQHAESIIRDTDMAKEMVAYSNYNILLQAGQSMLAQANMSQQAVVSLLTQS